MSHDVEQATYRDFTRDNYRRLIRLAKAKYPFATYAAVSLAERFVLWRHDVDMSVHAAAKLAGIEADEGVVATYFLMVRGRYYNLFERPVRDRVRSILALGHHLGLHFELGSPEPADAADLEADLAQERRWLEELFGVEVRAFSFHDPTPAALSCCAFRYAGMVNCYAEAFRTAVGYCSDSNGCWRHRRLEDVLLAGAEERLQVLTHPEWWQEEPMAPRRRVHRCIDGRAERLKQFYDERLRELNRPNLGGD
jgi:hypothetical protein